MPSTQSLRMVLPSALTEYEMFLPVVTLTAMVPSGDFSTFAFCARTAIQAMAHKDRSKIFFMKANIKIDKYVKRCIGGTHLCTAHAARTRHLLPYGVAIGCAYALRQCTRP